MRRDIMATLVAVLVPVIAHTAGQGLPMQGECVCEAAAAPALLVRLVTLVVWNRLQRLWCRQH